MALILIAEDERVIRERWRKVLKGEGYDVRTARDGEEAVARFEEFLPDLVLLDVNMPRMNGFRVCEEIRRRDGLVPVVFLTAFDSEVNEVRAFGIGADDYISKSVSDEVWLTRVRARLARQVALTGATAQPDAPLHLGEATVDLGQRLIIFPGNGDRVRLTATETDLIRLLVSRRGKAFGVDEILKALRGRGFVGTPSIVRTHIYNLREKLGPFGGKIVCSRWKGYSLER